MEALILVPGIEGSRLSLAGSEIWPPAIQEYLSGYTHLAELRNPQTVATGIIDAVSCVQVYKPLMDDLQAAAASIGGTSVDAFYDWRKNISTYATGALVQAIDRSVKAGATSVTLVCHSMGGLIGRLLLESGNFNNTSWFKKITKFVGICVPNLGAPFAIAEALGLEGSITGVRPADIRTFSADPNYPAAYQCFPVPGYDVLWDASDGAPTPVNIYSRAGATKFGLTWSNVQAAQDSWNLLDITCRPPGVQYILFGGQNYSTDERFIYNGGANWTTIPDMNGDGTVPIWSSLEAPVPHYSFVGDHLGIFTTYGFRQTLFEVLGATVMPRAYITDRSGVALMINKMIFDPSETIEILIVPDFPAGEINGKLIIERANNLLATEFVLYDGGISVDYTGPVARFLPLRMPAPSVPGAYRISFTGSTHTSAATASRGFAVSKVYAPNPVIVSPRAARIKRKVKHKRKKASSR
jgi:phospholipase A1